MLFWPYILIEQNIIRVKFCKSDPLYIQTNARNYSMEDLLIILYFILLLKNLLTQNSRNFL